MADESMMEVEGDGKHIAERILVAASLAPPKSPRPVMSDVLIEARDGCLYVTGSDGYVSVRVCAERVEVKSAGRAIVNAARLAAVVREFGGEGNIKLEVDSNRKLLVRVPGSKLAINAGDPGDYPEAPAWPTGEGLALPAADLATAIERTAFAAAEEKSRYAMNGVCFVMPKDGTTLTTVATDGKRLAMIEMQMAEPFKADGMVVLPRNGAQVVGRLAAAAGGDTWRMHHAPGAEFVFLESPGARVWARPIEGIFPPFRDVMPKGKPDAGSMTEVSRDEFSRALRRASLLSSKESMAVRMTFARGLLTCSSRAPEVGEANVDMGIDWTGETILRGFNPAYWLEALKGGTPEKITIELHGDAKRQGPGVVRWPFNERLQFTYLLMPLNLNEPT